MLLKFLSKTPLVLLLFSAQLAQETQSQQHHIQELIDSLPEYSRLRYELQNGMHGPGKEQPYMERMREGGVRRAFYKLTCTWRHGKPQDVRVVRRLYFNKYDGPHTQIRDAKSLEAIRTGGLQDLLDQLAIERATNARLYPGKDRPLIHHPEGKQMYCVLQFLDDATLPGGAGPVGWIDGYYYYHPSPLADAAKEGDASGVEYFLHIQQFSSKELNRSLFSAVNNSYAPYDNSDVIDFLLRAGADINARDERGQTPLMYAIGRPIDVGALLERGADFNIRDSNGNTVLKLARDGGYTEAVKLLQHAGDNE